MRGVAWTLITTTNVVLVIHVFVLETNNGRVLHRSTTVHHASCVLRFIRVMRHTRTNQKYLIFPVVLSVSLERYYVFLHVTTYYDKELRPIDRPAFRLFLLVVCSIQKLGPFLDG